MGDHLWSCLFIDIAFIQKNSPTVAIVIMNHGAISPEISFTWKLRSPNEKKLRKPQCQVGWRGSSQSLRHSMHLDKKRVPQFTSPHNTGQTHLWESSVRDQITFTAENCICWMKKQQQQKKYTYFSRRVMKRQRHAGKMRKLIFHRTDLLNQMVLPQKGNKMIYLIRLIGDIST